MKTTNLSVLSPILLGALLAGCASTGESAGRDQMTGNVGNYPPPASDLQRVRLGVPAFIVAEGVEQKVSPLAADQITTLCMNSQRFDVIERAQLDQMLKEQSLEGVVTAGELARPAQVRGIEWLLLGKVTSLRVKQTQTGSDFNLGSIPIPGAGGAGLGLFGIDNKDTNVKVECGVDLRLVDPATGQVVIADFSEFDRTDKASAMGLQILGGRIGADASIHVDADDQGRILRLALDECVRKMLPKIDRALRARAPNATTAAMASDGKPGAENHNSAGQFCSHCGAKVAKDAKFCAGCGQKVE
jgi:curli biogenesis system outer membrane secretion channel CsgG/ribosomal protein L40E